MNKKAELKKTKDQIEEEWIIRNNLLKDELNNNSVLFNMSLSTNPNIKPYTNLINHSHRQKEFNKDWKEKMRCRREKKLFKEFKNTHKFLQEKIQMLQAFLNYNTIETMPNWNLQLKINI